MKTIIASLIVLASLAGVAQAAPSHGQPDWAVKAFAPKG